MNSETQPHVIRLRGPWQRTVLADLRDVSSSRPMTAKVTMPGSWQDDLGADFQGVVSYRRMFNCPTGITHSTSMRLRFRRVVGNVIIRLNENPIGTLNWPANNGSFDVTGRLEPRNQIDVEITAVTPDELANCPNAADSGVEAGGGLVGEVHLEIR